ncbi:MAG TPA: YbaB/EbfC family nucleoid-associated protein [Flavobacteriaceae bacterium]|nr:YbaB/EbfC family nucleoid-associated protein [Flavobacteriaceae bacterium]
MFGDFAGMMGKLQEAQKKIEETKTRLKTILIDEETANGKVKVTVTADGLVKNISIAEDLKDTEEIEDYVVLALNNALTKANEMKERELAVAAKDGMPNIPGMDNMFNH